VSCHAEVCTQREATGERAANARSIALAMRSARKSTIAGSNPGRLVLASPL